jgi:hypothetical protein
MVKTPLVPLRKNHKTQILFIVLFTVIFCTQIILVVPSKLKSTFIISFLDQKRVVFAYLITATSIILAISFYVAARRDPGYL